MIMLMMMIMNVVIYQNNIFFYLSKIKFIYFISKIKY